METSETTARIWRRRAASAGVFVASCAGWVLLSLYGKALPEWVGIPLMLVILGGTLGCAAVGAWIVPVITPPLDPATWNKTYADLEAEMAAGKRHSVSGEEIKLAQAYEVSLLPPDTVFPQGGQIWEALEPFEADYTVWYRAPYSTGGTATLPAGERIQLDPATPAKAVGATALPVRYDEMEQAMIPESTRRDRKYNGFNLYLRTADLNRHFRLVDTPVNATQP